MGYESAILLPEFLKTAVGHLSDADRAAILDQAMVVLDQVYAHLPLKRAMFAVDPLQRIRLLRRRLRTTPELSFHRELLAIFADLHDLHTLYVMPEPFRSHVAILPFYLELCFVDGSRRYLVSKVGEGAGDPQFVRGVVVTHWNGVPIDRAVEIVAAGQAGGNDAAKLARGVSAMTLRSLRSGPWPDEEWVVVRYQDGADEPREARFDWRVLPALQPTFADHDAFESGSLDGGVDPMTESSRRVRKELYAPEAVRLAERMASTSASDEERQRESVMQDNFAFRAVQTPHGEFGYVRIWSFEGEANEQGSASFVDAFAAEFRRILGLLPGRGLILDVRGNGGGRIPAGERLLEMLTPREITPASLHFRSTSLVETLCRIAPAAMELDPWRESVMQAVETGAIYSRGCPFAPFARAYNRIGQQYHGPVVLIVDALCYSTTDIFAAGFQDHNIGPVLGTAERTGAGGANVWPHEALVRLFAGSPGTPLGPLPGGASFVVAVRQVTRVGPRAGVPLEDLGVAPDYLHLPTRRDVLERNADLIAQAGALLARMPVRQLDVAITRPSDAQARATVTARGFTRLDVFVDDRPQQSLDVRDGTTELELRCRPQSALELVGYDYGVVVARRRVRCEAAAAG